MGGPGGTTGTGANGGVVQALNSSALAQTKPVIRAEGRFLAGRKPKTPGRQVKRMMALFSPFGLIFETSSIRDNVGIPDNP